MTKIDDPFDQVETQHRAAEQGQALTVGLNVAGPLIDILTGSPAGSLVTLMGIGVQFIADHRKAARAEAFSAALRDALTGVDDRVARIERLVTGPDAEEAIVEAVRSALSASRLDKARRFGQVVGGTLAADSPDWREAAEFVRNLEEFTETDLVALKLLWNNQRNSYRVMTGSQRGMDPNANEYAQKWSGVLDRAEKTGISKDDWYGRCARLSGFGLLVPVRTNQNALGESVYRLTGRAVRLLGLLGRNIDPKAFPSTRYHSDGRTVTVDDEDDERALGEGWADTPAAFQKRS